MIEGMSFEEPLQSADQSAELEWLAEIVNSSNDAIIGMTLEGKVKTWNQGAENLYGYQSNELVGRDIRIITPTSRYDELRSVFEQLSDGENVENFETVRTTRAGKLIPISITWSLIKDRNGLPIGVGAIHKNISRLKEAELRLNSAQKEIQRLLWVVSQTDNSMVIASSDGKIEWVNDGFEKLTGYSAADVIGTTGNAIMNGDISGLDPSSKRYQELIIAEDSISYEALNFKRNGETYWVLTTLSPIRDEFGKLINIVAIDSDISSRKEVEYRLRSEKKRAQKLARVKERFLTNMSHEIRTPMNAIIGLTELLEETDLDVTQYDYVKTLGLVGQNLLTIINDILDLSKLEAGKTPLAQDQFQLGKTVNSIIEMMQFQAPDHVDLIFNFEQSDITVKGDKGKLGQILINLVGNALKFTENGGVDVTLSYRNNGTDLGVTVQIKDTGIGISKAELDLIFRPFDQASSDTTKLYGGTGLGLTIARKMAELMDGSISATSEVGVGSEFELRVQLSLDDDKVKVDSTKKEEDFSALEGKTVLVVEDNDINRMIANSFLSKAGLVVSEAINGHDALRILALNQAEPDIILMDIQMPGMGGLEAKTEINNRNLGHIPVVAMTAHALDSEKEKCEAIGMNGFLVKPLMKNQLLTGIKQVLNV